MLGFGSGAIVIAILDQNTSSSSYGNVVGFNIVNGGSGYYSESTSYNLKQVFNVVGNGEPAQLTLAVQADGGGGFSAESIMFRRRADQSLMTGSGYVTSPTLRIPPYGTFIQIPRVPLVPSRSTSSLSTASFPIENIDPLITDAFLVGGFTHSPVYIDLNITAPLTGGNIASVQLLVDGQPLNELTINNPPYSFAWVPDEAREYSLSAAVTDDTGGRKVTALGIYVIKEFYGSGISASFNGDANITVPSNGSILLSADASSEYGIKEIEFFINNVSIGKLYDQGLPTFIMMVDLTKFNFGEGTHQISMVATDYQGNQAGSFDPSLTSNPLRQNKVLTCLPFLPPSQKPSTAITYPVNGFSTTSTSMIRLEANASDPDGSLEGVQFYVNGVVQDAWSGILDFNGTVPADGQLLTIDDGTGKAPVTFEFDNDQSLTGGGTANLVATQGNQLDDLSIGGTYTGYEAKNYIIEIDGIGTPNTFRWSKDGGVTFVNENVSITGAAQTLENGLSGTFTATIGHGLGDRWMIQASTVTVRVPIVTGGASVLANARRTRDAFRDAIENQSNLGLLSFFTNDEASVDQLNLYHKMDQILTGTPSVTGTSLTTGGGTVYLFDNDFEPLNGIPDNLIRRDHSYGLPFYPFGRTWTPGAPGSYYINSVAMDTISRNLVMSEPILITATSGTGLVPTIELDPVSSPMTYSGTLETVNLSARALDLDGKVIEVRFYGNGRLLSRDATVPYEATLDVNASGHYEVYAVVSDDDGNDITSTVQRIVVNSANETREDAVTLSVSPPSSFLGGFSTITGNFKSPSGSYDPNIRIEGYVNGMFTGMGSILPYILPAPGQSDPGYSFEFQFPARKVGLSDVEFVVVNGSETRSVKSTFEVEHSPITDNVTFIESVYQTLFQRQPEAFELNEWIYSLDDGSLTKAQLFDKLRCRKEFRKSVDIMLSHKTLWGDWLCLDKIMIEQEVADNPNGIPGGGADDYGNDEANAQLVTMNQVIRGQIELPGDIDFFTFDSLNPSPDGEITISVDAGNPGVIVSFDGTPPPLSPLLRGYNIVENGSFFGQSQAYNTSVAGNFGTGTANINRSNVMDRYYFAVQGNQIRTGSYTLRISNPTAGGGSGGGVIQVPGNVDSPVMDFLLSSYLQKQAMLFSYKNQFGEIGEHSPEELFRRIFVNKYEQTPSPIQIARGARLIQIEGSNQIGFIQDFAMDNSVITVGGYNYTSNLSIPNVPLDFAAFGETALVYCSLIGHAPTEQEVALLTLTPNYEIRCLSERAKMIMELPQYTARYGLSLPEVDFIGVENGRRFITGQVQTILAEALTLGNDRLSGTLDDNGSVRELDLFLNGALHSTESTLNANGYYQFTLPATLPSGEYRMEVVAKDSNGLQSRAERSIVLLGSADPVVELVSPSQGTVLQKGGEARFSYSADQNVTAYLEVDGEIRWKSHITFNGTTLPVDESKLILRDGTGRGDVTFEFDNNGLASDGNTTVDQAELMSISGTSTLSSSGIYLGTEVREYLVEIDTDGITDTFRWSINGGANFNNSMVPITANTPIPLSSGVSITFSSSTGGKLGDRWRIKAYPNNEMVEVHRFGTLAERVEGTKQNLIRAINRARNKGKLAIRSDDPSEDGKYDGSMPMQSLNEKTIILCHDGSYPIKEAVQVSLETTTTLVQAACLPLSTATGKNGSLSLNLGECFDLCRPVLEVRVCAFDANGSAGYSEPYIFPIVDPERLSVELTNPIGRKATLGFRKSFFDDTITASDIVILDGGIGYTQDTLYFTILSENGQGAHLHGVLTDGTLTEVNVLVGGSGYSSSDMIITSSPPSLHSG
ncbi:MAG: Ig-like domain-containing protein [Opitutales bacterium]